MSRAKGRLRASVRSLLVSALVMPLCTFPNGAAAAGAPLAEPRCETANPAPIAPPGSGEVRVQLEQGPEQGTIRLLLFDSADTFNDLRRAMRIACFEADDPDSIALTGIAPGEYALLVHFDEDGNGALDRNVLGIPIEPIAFSNDYRPKGPPAYARARFDLGAGEVQTFALQLRRPLGERGRFSAGIGVIGQSSPYVNYDGNVSRFIPVVTYIGKRLQVLGPRVTYALAGRGRLRLAATARLRLGAYEEDRSPVLDGLGDRDDTIMAGLTLVHEASGGIDLRVAYEHDVLDRAGGGAARLVLSRPFQVGIARITPRVGLRWLDEELSAYDFGVPADRARNDRPAYAPGATASWEVGVGTFIEITRSVNVVADIGVSRLDSAIAASPLVDTNELIRGFAALNYTF